MYLDRRGLLIMGCGRIRNGVMSLSLSLPAVCGESTADVSAVPRGICETGGSGGREEEGRERDMARRGLGWN